MEITASFGYWVRRRRKALDLTQQALADLSGCSLAAIKKIETDQRQPSQQLAERLADSLQVPPDERAAFLARARGLLVAEDIAPPIQPSVAAPVAPSALPAESTSFVGRAVELAQIERYLADPGCRLLTLIGPGGIGKTRLAQRAAAQARFAQGACFVPLADIAAPELAAPAVARRLGLQMADASNHEAGLLAYLRDREMLLVLDNVEQLLTPEGSAAALLSLLSQILDACPDVKLLLTSRERLNIQAEWLLPLAGLPGEDSGMALFVERAQRVRPSFTPEGHEATISTICRLVDGLPLAIELAAGWAQTLSCEQIADQIRSNIDFLATRRRDAPERHRSVRALFDGAWRLLGDQERELLMRLSVFQGGFTAETARAIAFAPTGMVLEAPFSILMLLSTLVDTSLVGVDGHGRYELHELTRRYAAERLAAAGETQTIRGRHLDACTALAWNAAAHFSDAEAAHWFERMHTEQANLGAAWDWAMACGDTAALYRLARPLGIFWIERGVWREGAVRLQHLLDRTQDDGSPERALAMIFCGTLLARSGHPFEALPYMTDGYTLAERSGDAYALGIAALAMSQTASEPAQRLRFCRQAIEQFRAVQSYAELARMLWLWGDELRAQSELEQARTAYAESLQLYRDMGNRFDIVYPLGNLGRLALLGGDIASAQRSFAECVELSRRTGNSVSLADWLVRLGSVALYQGKLAQARAALQEALALAQELAHNQLVPNILAWLAILAVTEGDTDTAGRLLHQCLDDGARMIAAGNQMRDTQYHERPDFLETVIAVAHLHAARSQWECATLTLSFATQLLRKQGSPLDPPLQSMLGELRATCRSTLGEAVFTAHWRHGQTLGFDQLVRRCPQAG
jgi:predicted ATPase/transcriptional regulator with XRE-family HTH domain